MKNIQIVMCINLTNKIPRGLTYKDSDLLNRHMIICIVDNQPEIDGITDNTI